MLMSTWGKPGNILFEVLNIALLKTVGVFGHKRMNSDKLLHTDLCICCSDIPFFIGSCA